MATLLAIILGLFAAIVLIYVFFKVAQKLIKLAFYIFSLIPIICSRFFFVAAKLLCIDRFIYHVLSLFTIPSLLYLCLIHIPYSNKEKIIGVKEAFAKTKKERQLTIAMLFFYNLIAAFSFYFYFHTSIDTNKINALIIGCTYAAFSFLYVFYKIYMWNEKYFYFYERSMNWHLWQSKESKIISENELEKRLIAFGEKVYNSDKNKFKFTEKNIPFGRATAFISYFNRNFETEEPVYFSPNMSSNDELREYGTLITTRGIYISKSGEKDIELPFTGLCKLAKEQGYYEIEYGLSYGQEKRVFIPCKNTSINLDLINESEDFADIPLIMLHNGVKSEIDETLESYKKSRIKDIQNKFDKHEQFKNIQNAAELGGFATGNFQNAHIVNNEVKNYMNGERGGGYGAEYGNNAFDRFFGKDVKNMAQDLENGHQKLHGADRNVDGINIQTKYYKSASESIGAAFKNKQAQYLNDDGTMMQIEVPRDQYSQAVEIMKKRIQNGEVPNETNPDNASNYVRKGTFTYAQANNIAIAGTIEGVAVDLAQGISCSLPGAGITAAITFANAIWNGQDLKEAAKSCALSSLKVIGKSTAAYVLTMQLSRDKIINVFKPEITVGEPGKQVVKSVGYIENPLFNAADMVAKEISSTMLAKSQIGKSMGLDKLNGQKVIGGTVTAALVYGPDICKAIQGKISTQQLVKNSVIGTVGLVAGATLGTAIPIPVVGSMLGATAGSFIAKELLDNFVEDDIVAMFRILREEFLDIVMLYAFNKEEFDIILNETLGNGSLSDILQNMFQSGMPKEYADEFISIAVRDVLSKRPKITRSMMEEGVEQMLKKNIAA